MTSEPPEPSAPRIPIWQTVVILGLALGLVAATKLGTPPAATSEAGLSMDLPDRIDDFRGEDQPVSEGERALLPPDTAFAKKLYRDWDNNQVNCQIVLAGAEKRSIHRPEVCLPGQGWNIKGGEVVPITLHDGKKLDVMKLTLSRMVEIRPGVSRELSMYFLYWFVGHNSTTPYHWMRIAKSNLDMLLHNVNHRWAYVIVSAPVLKDFTPNGKDGPETFEMLKEFVADIVPTFMLPAPDGQKDAVSS